MTLRYGSVCSGIESVTQAWHDLDFEAAWFAEIAKFPSKVLAARWPDVPNLRDFTKIGTSDDETNTPATRHVDVLVGGTPCQSFSCAGGRVGLDDPRGHLAVEFLLLARRLGARWLVWENVPGVLSVDDGDAFGTLLGLMVDLGYGVCWRVLDAQWCGVAQRRRRVFVAAYLGDWRPAAAVLFDRPSMQGNPASRGGAREDATAGTEGEPRALGDAEGRVVNSLTAHGFRQDTSAKPYVTETLHGHHYRNDPVGPYVAQQGQVAGTLKGGGRSAGIENPLVVETLRACAGKSTSSVGPLVVTPHPGSHPSTDPKAERNRGRRGR